MTDIPLPPMPGLSAPSAVDGDNSDEDCFTYQQTENGWIIDGLTVKQKDKA